MPFFTYFSPPASLHRDDVSEQIGDLWSGQENAPANAHRLDGLLLGRQGDLADDEPGINRR
jgi:hypothetical protein